MAREPNHEPLYVAAGRFVDQGLRREGSLFTPGEAIWTLEAAADLYDRFVVHEDPSSDLFDVKLARQLGGAEAKTIGFTAELLYVYHLFPSLRDVSSVYAQQRIAKTVALVSSEQIRRSAELPKVLEQALSYRVAPSRVGSRHLDRKIKYLVSFVFNWKQLTTDDQVALLEAPWQFKEFALRVDATKAEITRQALLHLVFPDTFESIVKVQDKEAIASQFGHLVTNPTDDIDRQLFQIRQHFQEEGPKRPFSFFDKAV